MDFILSYFVFDTKLVKLIFYGIIGLAAYEAISFIFKRPKK